MVFRMRCDHQSNPLGKNARDRRVGAFIQCEHPPRPHVPFSDRSFRYRVNRVHIFHGALTGIRGLTNQDIPGTLPVWRGDNAFGRSAHGTSEGAH